MSPRSTSGLPVVDLLFDIWSTSIQQSISEPCLVIIRPITGQHSVSLRPTSAPPPANLRPSSGQLSANIRLTSGQQPPSFRLTSGQLSYDVRKPFPAALMWRLQSRCLGQYMYVGVHVTMMAEVAVVVVTAMATTQRHARNGGGGDCCDIAIGYGRLDG